MATVTFGSNANNSFTALQYLPGLDSGMAAADIATINQAIRTDTHLTRRIGGRFDSAGLLYLPSDRGIIQCKPGDYVVVDDRGWPFVVRSDSIANGAWTHS